MQNIYYIVVKLVIFIVSVFILTTNSEQVGSKCTLPISGKPGICKLVNECPSLFEGNNAEIHPYVCSYYFNTPIVCCLDESAIDSETPFIFPSDGISFGNNGARIAEQKCKEYSKLLVHTVQAIPLVTNPEPIIAEVPKCDYNSIPLIVGGTPAEPGEFPHMALIGFRNGRNIDWNCGGTLISERYVLTAAHCITTRLGEPAVVRLGELNWARKDDGAQPEDFRVERIVKHPSFKAPQKYNDIGLIRLARPVQFNRFIRPACLWTKFVINHNKTIATGWGHTQFAGQKSESLLKVALDIIDNARCSNSYQDSKRILPHGIEPSMMCAGSLKGGKDTCQGDSGGPIQITSQDNQCLFYIVGITSFGKGCGSANSPAIYTRVSEYVDWIQKIVWP